METKEYLKILRYEIHSVVFATTDNKGLPVTRVIDIMLTDDNSLYFITAKGKAFYTQLMDNRFVALSGMTDGKGSMNKKAVSIRGRVECIGKNKLDDVFNKNPYMAEIYPQEESRAALEVFRLYEGEGEFFDLSAKPIVRESFYLGKYKSKDKQGLYYITDECTGCKNVFQNVLKAVLIQGVFRLQLFKKTACTAATAKRYVHLGQLKGCRYGDKVQPLFIGF